MEETLLNTERATARVQNSQRMEMGDIKKKAKDHLREQQLELTSTQ